MDNVFNITPFINKAFGVHLDTESGNKYRLCVTSEEIGTGIPYHVTISTISEVSEKIIMDFHMNNRYSFRLDGEIITLIID